MSTVFYSKRKNMNYKELYKLFIKNGNGTIQQYASPIKLLILYDLGNENIRASVETLNLQSDYKRQCSIPHFIDGEILVSQAFYSTDKCVVYCAWCEVNSDNKIVRMMKIMILFLVNNETT